MNAQGEMPLQCLTDQNLPRETMPTAAILQTYLVPVLLGVTFLLGGWVLADRRSRRRQEAAERDGELQLRRIMDNAPEALMILDVSAGRFAAVNDRAVQLYGWPAEQLLRMGVSEVSPPQQPDGQASSIAAAARVQEAVEGGEPVFPWVHRNAAGESVPCEVRLVSIPDAKRVLVRGSVVDISERLRAEDELRRSEERFRAVVDAQREFLHRWLPDGTRTFVSRAYCRFFERSSEELLGTNFLEAIDEQDRARILSNVAAMSPEDPVVASEVRVRRSDGQWHWLEWNDTGLFDDRGELVEIQSIGRDITERRMAQDKLEYMRSLLTGALEQSPAGIAIATAPDGHFQLANQAMLDVLGVSRENLAERLTELRRNGFYREDGTAWVGADLPVHRALLEGQVTRDVEVRIRRSDGDERWASISCAPVENASGEIVASVLVCADVTETKRSQLAIRGVVESVSAVSGKRYYEALVRELSKVLDSDVVFIGELIERENAIRPLALCIDGELAAPFASFDSEGTPASEVIHGGRRLVCGNVEERFPDDASMQGLAIKSYIGVPLLGRDGRPVGALGIYSRGPLEKVRFKVDILELFGTRASTELEGERTARVLVQSEERFRTAFEEAPIGTVILDREGRLRQANKTLSRLLGYSRSELATMRMLDLVHPDEHERLLQEKARILAGEVDGDAGEHHLIRKDGGVVTVNYSVGVMADPSGEKLLLAMAEDISARLKAEQDLEASRRLQRLVAEASATFLGCRPDEVDQKVEQVLARVGDFLAIDRIVLYEMSGDRATATHSWFSDGGEPAWPVVRKSDLPSILDWEIRTFKFSSLESLPEEATAERRIFSDIGVKSFIGIPLHVSGSTAGIFALATTKSERAWPQELEEWLQILGEMLASVIARQRVETELRENMELQRLVAEISASFVRAPTAEQGDPDHKERGLSRVVRKALERVGKFLEIDRISIYRLGETVAECLHSWHRRGSAAPFPELALNTQVPFLSRAANAGEVVSFSRIEELGEEMTTEREVFSRLGTRSFLAIPLRVGNSLVGCFTLATDEREHHWSSNLVQWMRVFGEMLASAIAREAAERAQDDWRRQLRGLAHQLTRAEEKERRRCASYLHDQIGQSLAVMRMRLGELLLPGTEQDKRHCVDEIRGLLEKTIEDTQTLTFDLSPPVLHDLGLVAAIEWIGEKVCHEKGIELKLDTVRAERKIRKNTETASILFRSVRELLVNAATHGAASEIRIQVEFTIQGIRITVTDNGVGFDTSILDASKGMQRFGLFSIRERLDFIGGSFQVSSRAGHGTRVSLFAPLETRIPTETVVP